MSIFVVGDRRSVVHASAVDAGLCTWLQIFILILHFSDAIIEWLKLDEQFDKFSCYPTT